MPPACKISIHTKPRDYYRHMSNTLLCYFVFSDVHRNQCGSQHRTHKGMSIKKALNNSCQPNKNGKNLPEVFGNWTSLSFNSKRPLALLLCFIVLHLGVLRIMSNPAHYPSKVFIHSPVLSEKRAYALSCMRKVVVNGSKFVLHALEAWINGKPGRKKPERRSYSWFLCRTVW